MSEGHEIAHNLCRKHYLHLKLQWGRQWRQFHEGNVAARAQGHAGRTGTGAGTGAGVGVGVGAGIGVGVGDIDSGAGAGATTSSALTRDACHMLAAHRLIRSRAED